MLRERCSAGHPAWRADSGGVLLLGPDRGDAVDPAGLLAHDPAHRRPGKRWSQQQDPRSCAVPRVLGIPLAEYRRRDRIGTLIALAMGARRWRTSFSTRSAPRPTSTCRRRAGRCSPHAFDELSASHHARPAAVHGRRPDPDRGARLDHAQFPPAHRPAYETIDLLYSLGRSMNDLTQPETFMLGLCERLNKTLVFGYVGACFIEDPRWARRQRQALRAGDLDLGIEELRRGLLESRPRTAGPLILTELGASDRRRGPDPGCRRSCVGRAGRLCLRRRQTGRRQPGVGYDIRLLEAAAGWRRRVPRQRRALRRPAGPVPGHDRGAHGVDHDAKDRYTCNPRSASRSRPSWR